MRVVFFTHHTQLYGANRSLLNLIDGLKSYNVESFVVAPQKGDITDALKQRNIPFFITPLQWWSSERKLGNNIQEKILKHLSWRKNAFIKLMKNICIFPKLCKQINEWNVDVVYSNSSVIPIGAITAMWINKPHVWHLREFGILDYNLTLHWGTQVFNLLLQKADAHIYISHAIRSFYGNELTSKKCHIVYNGVATKNQIEKLHDQTISTKTSKEHFIFAIIGLIHPNKGQDIAIRALALIKDAYPKVRLMIVGEDDCGGKYVKQLQDLAMHCDVEKQIIFEGYVHNPYEIYRKTDAVLMCSKYEALGRVTIEAMTACKPVIGYKSGGTAEIILNEVNGLLYKGDHTELANCMQRLIENPSLAHDMGEKGWLIAKDSYSIETYAKKIYEILTDVMN